MDLNWDLLVNERTDMYLLIVYSEDLGIAYLIGFY